MKIKKATIGIISAIAVFAVLAILSGIFDLKISDAIADLKVGQYYSDNGFGRFFEVVGEIPLYLFICYAMSVIFWNGVYFGKGAVRIAACAISAVAIAFLCYFIPHRVNEYMGELGSAIESKWAPIALGTASGVLIGGISLVGVMFTGRENIRKQLSFAVVILAVAVCSQVFTQGLKIINKRVRYRTINMYGVTDSISPRSWFTPWYHINGYPDSFKAIAELAGEDAVKSFPSGHTTAAGITYTLIALPFVFEKLDNKWGKTAMLLIGLLYTGIVAVARIVMGAHYFSDVLIGGSVSFAFSVLAVWLIYGKKLPRRLAEYCNIGHLHDDEKK